MTDLRSGCDAAAVKEWFRTVAHGLDFTDDADYQSRRHYVYILIDSGTPFYVGLGQGRRWKQHWDKPCVYNKAKDDRIASLILRSLGPEQCVVIAKENLTLSQAALIEQTLIAAIGREPFGPLVNLSDGGDSGTYGYKWTSEQMLRHASQRPEVVAKIVAKNTGKKRTTESRARMSEAQQNNALAGQHRLGFKETSEQTEKRLAKAREALAKTPLCWITDGKENRRHPIGLPLSSGWRNGRTFSSAHKAAVSGSAKPRSAEAKANIKASHADIWDDPEKRQRMMENRRPFSWYTDGVSQRRVAEGETPPDGWWNGMATKRGGSKSITNRVEGRQIPAGDTPPDGWMFGSPPKKPRIPGLEPGLVAARMTAGETAAAIAQSLGVSVQSVYKAAKKGGWLADKSIPPEHMAKLQTARQIARDNAPTRVWINDGVNNRQIEPSEPIPDGWARGHALSDEGHAAVVASGKLRHTSEKASSYVRMAWDDPESRAALMSSRADQAWITNGTETKRHWKSEPIPDGWRRGRGGLYGRASTKAKRLAAEVQRGELTAD